ncbi:Uncharacterized protein GBIM_01928 [Gryllus bimaculatus]|nr:Uncharacterized protein GBIM_01928 [Gryllus bimaculatus]
MKKIYWWPAALRELRRWTSEEALGDVTVAPDCSRLPAAAALALAVAAEASASGAGADGADHRLPSPEEQAATVAARFPGELVAVDVSGRAFRRIENQDESEVRGLSLATADDSVVGGSRSDSQKIKDTSSSEGIKAHFNSLKQWGKGKLKLIKGNNTNENGNSGLKTLKEEEVLSTPQTPLHSTSALSNSPGRTNSTLTAENEYELFGKGSTSTTTSSAGTVCTTLLVSNNESNLSLARGPTVPERKSSLDQKENGIGTNSQMVVAMVHKQRGCEMSESPDSGHNTSSSPVDSTSSPHGTLTGRSSEYEFSESDLEGVDRLERIRVKTTINSSRIPSMCVITPPPSDDETSLSQYVPSNRHNASVPSSNAKNRMSLLETDFGANIVHTQEKNLSPFAKSSEEKSKEVISEKSTFTTSKQTEDETIQNSVAPSTLRPLRFSPKFAHKDSIKKENKTSSQSDQERQDNFRTSLLPPFNNMIGKMKEVLSSTTRKDFGGVPSTKIDKINKDSGDYVTISKTGNLHFMPILHSMWNLLQ